MAKKRNPVAVSFTRVHPRKQDEKVILENVRRAKQPKKERRTLTPLQKYLEEFSVPGLSSGELLEGFRTTCAHEFVVLSYVRGIKLKETHFCKHCGERKSSEKTRAT